MAQQQQFPARYAVQQQQQPAAFVVNQGVVAVKYPMRTTLGLSIVHILCGLFSIGLGIAAAVLLPWDFGSAIWCGIVFCLTGSFGIPAAKTKRKGFIITHMVFSIISAIFSIIPFATYIIYFFIYGFAYGDAYNDYDYYYYYQQVYYPDRCAVLGLLAFVSLIEGIVAIVSSGFTCRGVCCRSGSGGQQIVYYYGGSGQPVPLAAPLPNSTASQAPTSPFTGILVQQGNKGAQPQGIPAQYMPAAMATGSAAATLPSAAALPFHPQANMAAASPPPSYERGENQQAATENLSPQQPAEVDVNMSQRLI